MFILQDNVTGPHDRREYFEDRWITRLDTKAQHEMNTNLKHLQRSITNYLTKTPFVKITSNNFYKHLYLSVSTPLSIV